MTTHLTDTQKQTIRIALAKWMGIQVTYWRCVYKGHSGFQEYFTPQAKSEDAERTAKHFHGTVEPYDWIENLPNYPASLDACHTIEVKLTDDKHSYFSFLLTEVLVQHGLDPLRHKVSAKAEHRSLALFRALNLGELGD